MLAPQANRGQPAWHLMAADSGERQCSASRWSWEQRLRDHPWRKRQGGLRGSSI